MRDYHCYFESEKYYHVFNRGNSGENIFLNKDNYHFFLSKWIKYINPYATPLAYCLMPNHFHFLIKIKSPVHFTKRHKLIKGHSDSLTEIGLTNPQENINTVDTDINLLLEIQFKKLFSSYALAFNKQQNRHGSLFEKRFKRVIVDSDSYFSKLIHYIHNNPIHHHFRENYESWHFSSYRTLVSDKASLLDRDEVLEWFGGKKAFVDFHHSQINYNEIKDIAIDLK